MQRLFLLITIVIFIITVNIFAQIPQTMNYQGVLTDTDGAIVTDDNYNLTFRLYEGTSGGTALWEETQSVQITSGIFNAILGSTIPLELPFDRTYYLGISVEGGDELTPRIELTASAYSLKAHSVADSSIASANVQNGQLVRSINSLKDDVKVAGGENITVSQVGDSLVISTTGVGDGDITGVVAGGGLTGGGVSGDVTLNVTPGIGIQVQPDEVRLDEGYVDGRFVNEGQANSVTGTMITDGTVGNADLASNAVTEVKIANNAVTAAKISSNIISSVDGVNNDGGNIDLVEGSNITITSDDAANTITIAATGVGTGDITAVNSGDGLTGGGTTGDVTLDVAAGTGISVDANSISLNETYTDGRYVNEAQANSVTGTMITDGVVGSADLASNAVTEIKIANNAVTAAKINPNIISSVAGVINDGGDIDFIAGSNITITPDDANNQITFSSTASNLWNQSGSDISYSSGNVGIGSSNTTYPLTIFPGINTRGLFIDHNQTGAESTFGIFVDLDRTGTGNADIYAIRSTATSDNSLWSTRGLMATANGNAGGPKYGVYATAEGAGSLYGVRGVANSTGTSSQYGIFGEAIGVGTGVHYGVYGTASGGGTLWAGYFNGNVYTGGNLGIGTLTPSTPLEVAGTIHSTTGGFMFPDGSVQTTASSGSNTLDDAYNAGRIITADAGAFEVGGVDGVLFTGAYGSGTIPVEGAGTRMMWYPGKASFRAGYVSGTQWDDTNIGIYSMAMGNNVIASGDYSLATGWNTTASGFAATALGRSNIASGYNATAFGINTTASGNYATTFGGNTTAGGQYSMAIGQEIEAQGSHTVAIALSDQNGLQVTQDSTMAIMGGKVGIDESTPTAELQVGGTDGVLFTGTYGSGVIPVEGAGIRMMWYPAKTAFRAGYVSGTQWDDVNIGDYSTAMGWSTTASGDYSTAMGSGTTASGGISTAMGHYTNASNLYSTAMGRYTAASGRSSMAMGEYTIASGDYSTAMGNFTNASNSYSTAMGYYTTASGYYSTAMGSWTTASGYYSTALGYSTIASGLSSTALGREIEANGEYTVAIALSDQNGLSVTQANTMAIMGGRVGIGTISPAFQLHTVINSATEIAMFENQDQGTDSDGVIIKAGPDANPGTGVDYLMFHDGDGTNIGSIDGNGSGGVRYNTTSDARLKMNIRDYSGGLQTVSQIKVRKYEKKSAPGIERIGLIAQELQKVYPQAVSGSPDSDVNEDPMMVDYGRVTPVLISAIQELQAENEKLKEEMMALKEENSAQKQRLVNMESGLKIFETFMVNYQNQIKQADSKMKLTNFK